MSEPMVTVTLRIGNHYADGTVMTEVATTVPAPGADDLDDWALEYLFEHTGVGREDDAMYDVEIVASSVHELAGRRFEFG